MLPTWYSTKEQSGFTNLQLPSIPVYRKLPYPQADPATIPNNGQRENAMKNKGGVSCITHLENIKVKPGRKQNNCKKRSSDKKTRHLKSFTTLRETPEIAN